MRDQDRKQERLRSKLAYTVERECLCCASSLLSAVILLTLRTNFGASRRSNKRLTIIVAKAFDQKTELRLLDTSRPVDSSNAPTKTIIWLWYLRNLANNLCGSRSRMSEQNASKARWKSFSLRIAEDCSDADSSDNSEDHVEELSVRDIAKPWSRSTTRKGWNPRL